MLRAGLTETPVTWIPTMWMTAERDADGEAGKAGARISQPVEPRMTMTNSGRHHDLEHQGRVPGCTSPR